MVKEVPLSICEGVWWKSDEEADLYLSRFIHLSER